MKLLRPFLKFGVWLLLGIFSLIHIYLVCVIWLSLIPVNSDVVPSEDVTIYIKTNGVHTDIVVPVKNDIKDWSNEICYNQTTGTTRLPRIWHLAGATAASTSTPPNGLT